MWHRLGPFWLLVLLPALAVAGEDGHEDAKAVAAAHQAAEQYFAATRAAEDEDLAGLKAAVMEFRAELLEAAPPGPRPVRIDFSGVTQGKGSGHRGGGIAASADSMREPRTKSLRRSARRLRSYCEELEEKLAAQRPTTRSLVLERALAKAREIEAEASLALGKPPAERDRALGQLSRRLELRTGREKVGKKPPDPEDMLARPRFTARSKHRRPSE